MHKYQELKVWQQAMDLVEEVYRVTANFPKEEKYGLVSQIQRCAVSIASDIAEGAGRNWEKEFLHFLSVAHGSCYQPETQIFVARRLKFIDAETSKTLCLIIQEIQKMNYSLQKKLKNNQ